MTLNEMLSEGNKVQIVNTIVKVDNTRRRNIKKQLLASCACLIGSLGFGMTNGFTATLFPKIIYITGGNETESWIASSVVISMLFGVLLSGFLLRNIGRRIPQILFSIPWIFGWPLMASAQSLGVLLVAASMVGTSAGMYSAISNVYIIEVCDARTRTFLWVFISVGVSLGILITHAIGIFMEWRYALLVSTVVPVVTLAFSIGAPETPSWLLSTGDVDRAQNIFTQLRGGYMDHEAEMEFETLLVKSNQTRQRKQQGLAKNFFSANFLAPLAITILLFAVQQGCGLNMIVYYAISFLQKIFKNLDPQTVTLQIDTMRLLASFVSVFFVNYTSRRKLLFCSATGTVLSIFAIVGLMRINANEYLLIAFMMSYMTFVYIGLLPLPWLIVGELYPEIMRDVGISISTLYAFITIFIIVKTGPLFVATCGISTVLLVYAGVVVTCSTLLFFFLPETRNISLAQIEGNVRRRRGL